MSGQDWMIVLAGCCVVCLGLTLRHEHVPFGPKVAKALHWSLLAILAIEVGLVVFGAFCALYIGWKSGGFDLY